LQPRYSREEDRRESERERVNVGFVVVVDLRCGYVIFFFGSDGGDK
jgi:hypothetical protein